MYLKKNNETHDKDSKGLICVVLIPETSKYRLGVLGTQQY